MRGLLWEAKLIREAGEHGITFDNDIEYLMVTLSLNLFHEIFFFALSFFFKSFRVTSWDLWWPSSVSKEGNNDWNFGSFFFFQNMHPISFGAFGTKIAQIFPPQFLKTYFLLLWLIVNLFPF